MHRNFSVNSRQFFIPSPLPVHIISSHAYRMPSSSSYSSALPSVGPPISGWSTPLSKRKVCVQDKRQKKLGLWSAVALQQHFTSTGGQRSRMLPSSAGQSAGSENAQRYTNTRNSSLAWRGAGGEATVPTEDLRAHLGPARSPPGHPHKPTLAQRMGLVPAPPPPPSADDWQVVVHRAMLREQQSSRDGTSAAAAGPGGAGTSASVCSICQMSFLSTCDEGQVILSCSHVFHAQCFRAFERCVRAQQRADGAGIAEVTAQLACPVCRTPHYYKRVFYEGKAMIQRVAIVKVQSVIRGFLTRRTYVQMRLCTNAGFRSQYVQERLARLSAAWSAFCAQSQRRRESTLMTLAVQHQAATAAYLTEDDWKEIWVKLVKKIAETNGGGGGSSVRKCVKNHEVVIQCPICLERIRESYFTQRQRESDVNNAAVTGDDAVAALRLAYEARQNAARAEKLTCAGKGKSHNSIAKSRKKTQRGGVKRTPIRAGESGAENSMAHAQLKSSAKQSIQAAANCPPSPAVQLPHLKSLSLSHENAFADGPRSGVLLSCGHCFHEACIRCYERYNEQRTAEMASDGEASGLAVVLANRCPICRAGYAKHPL